MNNETNAVAPEIYAVKKTLTQFLAGRQYFFGARASETGINLIVEEDYDKEYVQKAIEQFSGKISISLQKVSSLDDYLCFFMSNKSRINNVPEFLKVEHQLERYLKSKTWLRHKIYTGVFVLDMGQVLGVIDFLYLAEGTLFLYKIGASRKHKEMRLRNRALERCVDFFEKRFSKYFSKIQAFTAFSIGRHLEVLPKFERNLAHKI